jgi:hypothetical protein
MVHTGQMKNAMQHQNPDFVHERVAVLPRLCISALNRNGHLTEFIAAGGLGEGKHISWTIVIQKLAIQLLKPLVVRNQTAKGATRSDAFGKVPHKAPQAALFFGSQLQMWGNGPKE